MILPQRTQRAQRCEPPGRPPLTQALSPRRGEGDYFLGTLPRAAVRAGRATMRTLPWANIFLPLQGGSLAACAASMKELK
jgi:hypothetical protein